jgi:hypothetical protein
MAPSIDSSPPATIPTIIEVVVDEDWITEVARIPIKSPTTGFDVVLRSVSANSFPKSLKEAPNNVIERINKYRKNSRPIGFDAALIILPAGLEKKPEPVSRTGLLS